MEANAGEYIKKYLHLKTFPRISLHCKLVPVQYREYEYGLSFEPYFDFQNITILRSSFVNLIFAIIAPMLSGNHLNYH